jgi:hypothetical protein
MENIILDKCFLQGSSASRIHELADRHRLLVSDGLFYELLTCGEPARSRCFAKFPAVENPVDLVSHIGTLARKEIDTHCPAGKPSENREELRFVFNAKLVGANYELPEEAKQATTERFSELRESSKNMLDMALTIEEFFPGLLSGNQSSREAARASAEALIVAPGSLNEFIGSLEAPDGHPGLPPAYLLDDRWAIYRWFQVKLLFALDLYVRHQGRLPEMTDAAWVRLEHDVLDAEVLSLGVLEGVFATREKKLIRWWKLLRPDGILYE